MPHSNHNSGPLSGHVRRGRVYRSPLAATMVLEIGNWVRDDLPDLLWPVLTLSELGTSAACEFIQWQKAVQDDLAGLAEPDFIADCLDGRLTTLDRLAKQVPAARESVVARAAEVGILPESVARVLAWYPDLPVDWLTQRDSNLGGQAEIDLLARAVLQAQTDHHREAVIKCLRVWSALQAGTLRTSDETIELLKDYPVNLEKRDAADSVVRAMWGAHRGLLVHEDKDYFTPSLKWARTFWAMNSITTECIRRRDIQADETVDAEPPAAEVAEVADRELPQPGETPEGGTHLRRLAMDLMASFVEALELSPSDLHRRERQEVISGLISKMARDVIVALSAPDLWSIEHGAHVVRSLVEGRIYIQWMATQDPAIYRQFQDYGAGKAKLYARIMAEIPESDRHPEFVAAIEELERLSHNDPTLDHRVVDTRDSFADGKSIRSMAEESGLLDFYRQTYSMASGVAHSEWWSIETHMMERCMNVLHGGHRIPSLSLSAGGNVELAASWVDHLHTAMRLSFRILGTDKEAVEEAFVWVDGGDTKEADSGAADGD